MLSRRIRSARRRCRRSVSRRAELPADRLNLLWAAHHVEQLSSLDRRVGLQEKQIDDLKTVFIEGNPYFLALTFFVSLLHSVFDMLAFKNDIGFWKSNKSMEGLSATTIIINACCQVVIFFYLLDNETSTVVLLSAGPFPIPLFCIMCSRDDSFSR